MDTKMDDAVCNVIRDLQYEGKDDETIINYIKDFFECDESTAKAAYDIFNERLGPPASPEQIAYANAVAKELLNKPKCPTCQSTNVQEIGDGERAISIIMLGLHSNKINKSF